MSKKNSTQAENTIPAGYTLDYVSGKQIKETKKELVRQRIVRALIHEYGFSPEDMELDFSIGGRKKVDVAIFHHGKEHIIENLGRAVICRQEPNVGKNAIRIRDFEQAAQDLDEIEAIMREVEAVKYGLWTNGLEFFFVEKEQQRFETKCNPIGDWPMAEESVGTKEIISDAHTRVADNEMLKITFRRCHNFIHGNEGMPKDAAFWQFLYLIFAKCMMKTFGESNVSHGSGSSGLALKSSLKLRAERPFVLVLRRSLPRLKSSIRTSSGAMRKSPSPTGR